MNCICGKQHYVTNFQLCKWENCDKDAVHKFQTGLIYWQLCEEHFIETAKKEKIKTI